MPEFVRLYKFYPARSALLNIRDRHLKISRIEELNDPFELHALSFRNAKDRSDWRRAVRKFGASQGLISFSKNWRNPVLWSHYTEKHTGLCLGFDVDSEYVNEIKYQKDRIPVDEFLEDFRSNPHNAIQQAFNTKYEHWNYEEEWRIIATLDSLDPIADMYFKTFDKSLVLREVIIGDRSTISSEKIQQILGVNVDQVEITTARLAFHKFEVVPQRSRKLRK